MLSGNFSVLCHIVGLHKGRSLTNRLSNFLPFLGCALKTLTAVHLVQILVVATRFSLVGSQTPGTGRLS
jgi:purine-cytosine permease-like protein